MFSNRRSTKNFVYSAFAKNERPSVENTINGNKLGTESPWQKEVKENGELFYVEEDEDAGDATVPKIPDSRNVRGGRKLDEEHNLHGVSKQNNHGGAKRINFIKNADDGGYERSEALSSETISNKDAYRDYQRRIQRDHPLHKNIPNDSFKLHSEQIVSDLKNVTIFVKAASTYGRKGTSSLLERMIGIISINNESSQKQFRYSQSDQLVVNGLLPNSPAAKSESVDLDDTLLALNDVAVYKSNVEQVLSRVPHAMELKMTFLCQRSTVSTEPLTPQEDSEIERELVEQRQYQPSMIQLLKPSAVDTIVTSIGPYHAIFYLTLNVNSETARGEEDILYSYPTSDNPSTRKLKSVRGIFTTLADVSSDAFNSKVRSSTLLVDEELVHCAYCHQGSEVFVICVPSSIYPLPHLHKIVVNTVQLLNVMFESVSLAFKAENLSRLDHLFYLLFSTNNWTGTASQEGSLPTPVSGTRMLILEEELTADIDMSLAELEAADFDDGYRNHSLSRRLYTILGSCLFYKGYLVGNHLPDEDLKDISIFCKSYCLLGKLRVGQLVIWRQVFPRRRKSDSGRKSLGFRETNGNYFYLIVGLHYSLICILLEAGGCSIPLSGKRGPDPLYVNRARATILHLDSLSVPGGIEEHLSKPAAPTLSSADSMSKKPPTSLFSSSQHKPPSGSGQSHPTVHQQGGLKLPFLSASKKSNKSGSDSGPFIAPNMSSTQASPSALRRIGSQKSLASQGSVDSSGSGSKVIKSLVSGFSMADVRSALPYVNPEVNRLTNSVENTLFHYLQFDSTNGILITPTDQDVACLDGPFHHCVIENFRRIVLLLHERLVEANMKEQSQKLYEEGVLFHCQLTNILPEGNKKATPFVQYWVVGRSAMIQQCRHEFYVCFHDSAQQDMTEMAFRMGFGIVTS